MDYVSKSQLARVFSEHWVSRNGFCLMCESDRLIQTPTNTESRDFECQACSHPYELKSSIRPFGSKIVDGAFASMMRRIESKSVASFLLLRYSAANTITTLSAVHRSLITPEIVERRRPLSATARRAGWVGCNILLSGVPPEGWVQVVDAGVELPRTTIRLMFAATEKLAQQSAISRSWARALLACLHRIETKDFTLAQVYQFESELNILYPRNRNIRAKIRQQLQVLRDAGLVSFMGKGRYRLVFGYYKSLNMTGGQ